MVPVNLYDYIELGADQTQGIILYTHSHSVPEDEDNIAYHAAQAFFSGIGIKPSLSIKLLKNIPVAASLGGGSSNAACTLKVLNKMGCNSRSFQDLSKLAVNLGADVPLFLYSRPSIARGIDAILELIGKWPKFWYVIVMSPISVSTSRAYDNLRLKLTTDEYHFILSHLERESLDLAAILENDLEAVTVSHFPVISAIKGPPINAGAESALMSGRGLSVFAIFIQKLMPYRLKGTLTPRVWERFLQ